MSHHIRRLTSLLAATALVGWCMLYSVLYVPPAFAAIRQLEEAPGQVVYQSRQTLKDQRGDRWQLIAFNRIRPNSQTSIQVRIVGFPGMATFDRTRPMTLVSSLGEAFTAPDTSKEIFSDKADVQPYIGQYNLQGVLPQVQTAIPVRIVLPLVNQSDSVLSLSPALIEEWKALADYH